MSAPEPRTDAPLARLELDGILRREGERHRTTRRWQAAMARAAHFLKNTSGGADQQAIDLRVPIAVALVELYGRDHPDDELTQFVDVLVPIEASEIIPDDQARARR